MRSRKKGFTIVELMIVIVIIGILIAIIVPTVTSAIESANIASDQSDVKNMNTILQVYCVQNGIDTTKLQAPEVRAIVSSEQKNYTFVPKSSKGIYWYSVNEGKIVYSTNGDPNNVVLSNVAHAAFKPSSPEELVEGYLYLNTGDELDEVFTALRSVINRDTYENVLDAAALVEKFTGFEAHIKNNFDPLHTLYISSTSMYKDVVKESIDKDGDTSIDKDGDTSIYIDNVVFATGITVIPKVEKLLNLFFSPGVDIVLPATVKVVEQGSFISVMTKTRLVVNNSSTKVVEGALSESIKEVANVENISLSDYKNNIKGNSLVKIQIVNEDGEIDTVSCNDMSNKKLSTDGVKAKIDLTKVYTVNNKPQYSLEEGDTSSEPKVAKLASSQIIIRTDELMKKCPDINAIDIKYISKKADDKKSSPYNTIDIYVRAFNDSGTVVDMIITYIPAIPAPDTET